jgi:hypothetical protein
VTTCAEVVAAHRADQNFTIHVAKHYAAVAVGGQSLSVELKPGKGHRPESCREEAFFDNQLLRDTGLESKLP